MPSRDSAQGRARVASGFLSPPIQAVPNFRQFVCRNADAVVANRDEHFVGIAARVDVDAAAVVGVLHRVVEKIGERLANARDVHFRKTIRREVGLDADLFLVGDETVHFRDLRQQLGDVPRSRFSFIAPDSASATSMSVFRIVARVPIPRRRRPALRRKRTRIGAAAQCLLGRRAQPASGVRKIVRDVVERLAHLPDECLIRFEQAIEEMGETIQFVCRLPCRHAGAEIFRC